MSEKEEDWEPQDEFLGNHGRDGQAKIDGILEKHHLSRANTITSRDVGVDMARYDLRRKMPPGWFGWQLPTYLLLEGDRKAIFFFLQTALPGTILPSHAHDVAQLRLVLAGRLIYTVQAEKGRPEKSIELGSGDWIYTPPKAEYTLSVATNPGHNAVIYYCY